MTQSSYTYISPGLLATMRREMDRFLLHTYTRIPRVPPSVTDPPTLPAEDDWGLPTYTFNTVRIENLPCLYVEREVPLVTPNGLITVNKVQLYVHYTDELAEGDRVDDVTTADGTVLISDPVLVEEVTPEVPNVGGTLWNLATLRKITTLPSS